MGAATTQVLNFNAYRLRRRLHVAKTHRSPRDAGREARDILGPTDQGETVRLRDPDLRATIQHLRICYFLHVAVPLGACIGPAECKRAVIDDAIVDDRSDRMAVQHAREQRALRSNRMTIGVRLSWHSHGTLWREGIAFA